MAALLDGSCDGSPIPCSFQGPYGLWFPGVLLNEIMVPGFPRCFPGSATLDVPTDTGSLVYDDPTNSDDRFSGCDGPDEAWFLVLDYLMQLLGFVRFLYELWLGDLIFD